MTLKHYQQIIIASLLADAHAMPLHWNYSSKKITSLIRNKKIDLSRLNSGKYSGYFKGKQAGEQSHQGDQIIHLHKYIQTHSQFDVYDYASQWKQYLDSYQYYIDKSSQQSFGNIALNIRPYGADSSDFCGASMGLPLIFYALDSEEQALQLAQERTSMTHNNTLILDTVVWFIMSLFKITNGSSIIQAMDMSAEKIQNPVFREIYETGKEFSMQEQNIQVLIDKVGMGCDVHNGLPVLRALLEQHQNNFLEFVKANTQLGGDSSSRALIGGAFIGAKDTLSLPEELVQALLYTL